MADSSRPVTGYPSFNGYSAPPPNLNPPYFYQSNPYNPPPPPTGTAHPYASPPPRSNPPYSDQINRYHPQNYQPDPDSVRRATCLRRVFAFIIGVVIIFGTVTFIVWLVLRPLLPQFRVDSFSISNFTLTNDSLASFTSEIRLTARNPNKKMTLSYESVSAYVFYRSTSLSETSVAPFSQDTKNETSVIANFAAAGSFVDKSAVDAMNTEKGKNGDIGYNFRMVSRIKFEAKAWRTRRRSLMVFCGDLRVSIPGIGNTGALTSGSRQCRVGN